MKITSQLGSTVQNLINKPNSGQDDGTQFQNAFAVSANRSMINSVPQNKMSKTQAPDTKPQTSDSKNKEAASDSALMSAPVLMVPPQIELVSPEASKMPVRLPVVGNGSSETFDQIVKAPETIIGSGIGTGTAPAGTVVGRLDAAGGSSTRTEVPVDGMVPEKLSPSKNGAVVPAAVHPAESQVGAIKAIQSAAANPVVEAGTKMAVRVGDGTGPSVPADPSNAAVVAGAVDPSVLAAQQGPAALVQSITVPNSRADLSSVSQVQAASPIATSKTASATPGVEMVKNATSGKADSPLKGKSTASDLKSKRSDESGDDSQSSVAVGASATVISVKDSPIIGTVNHGANDSKGTVDGAGLQQMTQAGQSTLSTASTPSNHGSDSAQLANNSAGPVAQPVQAVSESPAMQGVSSAQLVQSMHSSEMKLGMQSAEFGNISISTSLNHQALSAQISIDHSELGRALAVHLPAIEERLGSAYGVQAKVELRDTNNPQQSSDSGYSNSGQQSREQRQSQTGASATGQVGIYQPMGSLAVSTITSSVASTSRLDIRV